MGIAATAKVRRNKAATVPPARETGARDKGDTHAQSRVAIPAAKRQGGRMPAATEPIKPLVCCPKCGAEMRLFGIEPQNPQRDLYTFECEKCDRIEVRGVRVV